MVRASRRREEVERWLRLRETRGLSLRELGEQSGIPAGTLAWWAHRLRTEAASERFVEVRVRESDGTDAHHQSGQLSTSRLRVRLPSGVAVTVDGNLADRVTEALIEALRRW